MPTLDEVKLACAKATHEVNRRYCEALGDHSQVPWEDAPEWQRESALKGVDGVLAGDGPGKSHENWLAEKVATGWKYGPVKDPEKKEHPCMVPFDELPQDQQMKDMLFVSTVRMMAAALGHVFPVPTDWTITREVLSVTTRPA